MAAVADRGAALELKLRALEEPSVEEPVLVHIARRCDLHHMRTPRHAAATAMYDTDMQEATTRQAVVEPAADDKEHVA
jgi:hypothetical protein